MNPTWLDRNRNIIFISLLVLTTAGIGGFYLGQPAADPIALVTAEIEEVEATPTSPPLPSPTATPGKVRIYITGAVVNPDVYILLEGSIIKDVVLAAGGLTAEADTIRINQALEVEDQQHIHVPYLNEIDAPPVIDGPTPEPDLKGNEFQSPAQPLNPSLPQQGGLININTATLDQLDTLPGIGPALAQRIIDHREAIGAFPSVEAIMEVSGIGEATFAKIQALITIE